MRRSARRSRRNLGATTVIERLVLASNNAGKLREFRRLLEPLGLSVLPQAELGIGTNDRATRPDNILEAEKILGTIHIALGDNSGFGGTVSTPYHEDYVFYQPTLTAVMADASRITVLREGSLEI